MPSVTSRLVLGPVVEGSVLSSVECSLAWKFLLSYYCIRWGCRLAPTGEYDKSIRARRRWLSSTKRLNQSRCCCWQTQCSSKEQCIRWGGILAPPGEYAGSIFATACSYHILSNVSFGQFVLCQLV